METTTQLQTYKSSNNKVNFGDIKTDFQINIKKGTSFRLGKLSINDNLHIFEVNDVYGTNRDKINEFLKNVKKSLRYRSRYTYRFYMDDEHDRYDKNGIFVNNNSYIEIKCTENMTVEITTYYKNLYVTTVIEYSLKGNYKKRRMERKKVYDFIKQIIGYIKIIMDDWYGECIASMNSYYMGF